jgi:hypothetical protein
MTTAVPPGAGGPPGWVVPDDDVADEDVDVRSLAGTQPPAEGAWLWVTTAEGRRGGEFTALALPRVNPRSCGGDVLLHVGPGGIRYFSGTPGEHEAPGLSGPAAAAGLTAAVRVLVVVAGSLVHVASWDHLNVDQWPEQVRGTVAFTLDALRELQEHGADIGVRGQVEAEAAAQSVTYGFPGLPARVNAAGG